MTTTLPSAPADAVILLLPAMALNASEFPQLSLPTLAVRYDELVEPLDDAMARALGMNAYVHGLHHWLEQQPGWSAAPLRLVVAHSFGAMLALDWLSCRPEPGVDGLVLISASAGPLFERIHMKLLGLPVRVPMARVMPLWNTRAVTRACKRLFGGGRSTEPTDLSTLRHPTDFAVDRAGWHDTDWRRLRALRLSLEGFDVRERLRLIQALTIVLHGTDDTLFDPKEAQFIASRIPGAELRLIDKARHALPITHPTAVRTAVTDMCRRLNRRDEQPRRIGEPAMQVRNSRVNEGPLRLAVVGKGA